MTIIECFVLDNKHLDGLMPKTLCYFNKENPRNTRFFADLATSTQPLTMLVPFNHK